ncbi:hypothetical protein KCV87_01435 [Actinosynnema pretiosum subsp. pretiosum]|uniref:Filamentous hemagglutinin n=1 Tax=Actinosynnema pretiosum subsp. pretiosum TaxID=103721 RepID=A0AA45L782_9PSEU|nr:filamentous Hemagglutinin [Actinosynnema pretiosum subsp. pretiosum]QUF04829.1 hypothetical protein KCV87_01435 [Actinosynnema pretiosum subsp. pretiosum]
MPKTKKPKPSPAGTVNASAGIFTPVVQKLRTGKRPAGGSSNNPVQALDVGSYESLKKREKVGDNLEHDHIPSSAALKKAEEKRLGRKLTPQEARDLHQRGSAIEVPKDVHAKSDTYRGRNTPTQIGSDAADLSAAAKRDYATTRANLLAKGYSAKDVDAALDALKAENRKKGIL